MKFENIFGHTPLDKNQPLDLNCMNIVETPLLFEKHMLRSLLKNSIKLERFQHTNCARIGFCGKKLLNEIVKMNNLVCDSQTRTHYVEYG